MNRSAEARNVIVIEEAHERFLKFRIVFSEESRYDLGNHVAEATAHIDALMERAHFIGHVSPEFVHRDERF